MTRREDLVGRGIFEVFPDNPDDPGATGVSHLRASLDACSRPAPRTPWPSRNTTSAGPTAFSRSVTGARSTPPCSGADRRIEYIIHRVEDVTEFVRQKSQPASNASRAARPDGADGGRDFPQLAAIAGRQPAASRRQCAVTASQGGGGGCQSGQEYVSVDHVSRNPHADERHSRLRPVDVAGSRAWERTRKRISRSSAEAASICWPS